MRHADDYFSVKTRRRTHRLVRVASISLALLAISTARLNAELPTLAEVEEAVLAADAAPGFLKEKWMPVVRMLKDVNERTPHPVLRLIRAHACLAANKNNEAVCLFLSVQREEDRLRWLAWAGEGDGVEGFVSRYPKSPIGRYYKGDALARLGKWGAAIACFDAAIDHTPNKQHALALNARSVAKAQVGDHEAAFDDAFQASQQATCFADPHANLGALSIAQREGATSALGDFTEAIRLARKSGDEFAVALYGRSCIEAVLGQDEEAEKDRNEAFDAVAYARSYLMAAYEADLDSLIASVDSDRNTEKAELAKFGIQSKVIDALNNPFYTQSRRERQLGQAWELAQSDPHLRKTFTSTLRSTITNNKLGPGVHKNLTQILQGAGTNMHITGMDQSSTAGISSNTSANLGFTGPVPHGSLKSGFDTMQSMTVRKQFEPTNSGLGNIPKVKGFATVPERVVWDSDACPFTPVYALVYRLPLSEPAIRPGESTAVSAGRRGTVSTPMGSQTGEAE